MAILQGFAKHHKRGGRRDAGLHQREIESRVLGSPLGLIYIGEGEEGAPPLGFPPLEGRQPQNPSMGGGHKGGGEGGAGSMGLRAHLPSGFAPSPLLGALGPLWEIGRAHV